jgi:fatty-acyl-CoA synthase
MKLAFSTLGCPDSSWVDIYSMAKDLGYHGIEIRGLGEDIFAVKAHPFLDSQIGTTLDKLKSLNLEIPCLSSGCCLKFREKESENIAEITEYINLARKLKTPYIRILADREAAPEGEVDDEYIISVLKKLAVIAGDSGVTLLVETNGVYADSSRLGRLLDKVGSISVAALWDLHHPYRFFNETPHQTVANLGNRIKHVHIKDSVLQDGKIQYKLLGEGDMPLPQMLASLQMELDYRGYVSLEWRKRWHPTLEDSGIVFPQCANYMERYIRNDSFAEKQSAKSGRGTYIWPKEHLIDETFPEVLDIMCREYPGQTAFDFAELDYTRTYCEFRDDVDTFARALIAMGVKRGDHVAVWSTNRPEWFITFWATIKIGAVLVTVKPPTRSMRPKYLLRQSDTHTPRHGGRIPGQQLRGDHKGALSRTGNLRTRQPGERAPSGTEECRHHREHPARLLQLARGNGKSEGGSPLRGLRAPEADKQARCVQHAVHLRNHRFPQGCHADSLQRRQQRKSHRRLSGPLNGRQAHDPCTHVPLLLNGSCHDSLHDARNGNEPHAGLLSQEESRLHQ